MTKLILNPEYRLYERNSQAYCSSRQVAEEFSKQHGHVLRDIEKLDCSEEFRRSNYGESSYKNEQGKWQPEVLMTKDGFTFIVMGYRGKKAAAFKEALIARFNKMEQFIKSLQATKIEFPAFTDAIMGAHEEPKHYHFSNEINLIYRIVLGMDAKKFRDAKGLEKNTVIKPYLTTEQIQAIEALQRADIGMIFSIPDYEQRKKKLEQYFAAMQAKMLKGA